MFGGRVPMILQSEAPECGIACVAMVASYHGFRTDLGAMRLRLAPCTIDGRGVFFDADDAGKPIGQRPRKESRAAVGIHNL